MKILIVSKDDNSLRFYRTIFNAFGFFISNSRTGGDALKLYNHYLYNSSSFDIVLIDNYLPDMEGKKLLEKFKDISPNAILMVLQPGENYDAAFKKEILQFGGASDSLDMKFINWLKKLFQAKQMNRKLIILEHSPKSLFTGVTC